MNKRERASCFEYHHRGQLVIITPTDEDDEIKFLQPNDEFTEDFESAVKFKKFNKAIEFLKSLVTEESSVLKNEMRLQNNASRMAEFGI